MLLPLLAASGGLSMSSALALELGDLNVESPLGQPLRASIAFALGPNEMLEEFCVYLRPGRGDSGLPGIGRASISVANGTIRLTGNTPVLEPLMATQVVIDCPYSPHLVREYTVLVDPVTTVARPVAAPGTAPVVPAARTESTRPATATRDSTPIGPDTRYQVQPGDTLSGIVKRIDNRRLALWPAVNAIFAANPDAFLDSDPNKLKAGAWLTIPSMDGSAPVVQPSPAIQNAAPNNEVTTAESRSPAPVMSAIVEAYSTTADEVTEVTVPVQAAATTSTVVDPATAEPVQTSSSALPAVDTVTGELVGDEPAVTLMPGDIVLDDGTRIADSVAPVAAPKPVAAAQGTTPAPRSIAVVRTESETTGGGLLYWLAGFGVLLLGGLAVFGRRLLGRFGSQPIAPAPADIAQPASADFEAASIGDDIDFDLSDDSPTDENPILDANLVTGAGFNEDAEMDVAQDFGFAATTDLDIDLPFEPVRAMGADDQSMMIEETDIIPPMRTDSHSILDSEVLPEDDDYDLSVIIDATKMPQPDEVTERDLMAVEVEITQETPAIDDRDDADATGYVLLEQDYEDELTATQALNLQIEQAAADLAARLDAEDADDTDDEATQALPRVAASSLDETAQLPKRRASDSEKALDDTSASGAVTISMAAVDRAADNDATAEMEIEGGTINTKAR